MSDDDPLDEDGFPEEKPAMDPTLLAAVFGIVAILIASAFIVLQEDRQPADSPTNAQKPTPASKLEPTPEASTSPTPKPQAPQPPPTVPANPAASAGAPATPPDSSRAPASGANYFDPSRQVVYWWRDVPEGIRSESIATKEHSNMLRQDHVGDEACIKCHQTKHNDWMEHSHRRMHELATTETVEGDFSGGPDAEIRYLGGLARFFTDGGSFRMSLERDNTRRVYAVERTIGSRFFQYYVGNLIEGPEPEGLPLRSVEQVLPFGYWLDRKEWVPTVHVFRLTREDDDGFDPFNPGEFSHYDSSCASCHTTLASGDWMMRNGGMKRLSWHSPRSMLFHVPGYLRESQPAFIPDFKPGQTMDEIVQTTHAGFGSMSIRDEAAELGVSCEACHNGCREHVAKSTKDHSDSLPFFFPVGKNLFNEGTDIADLGRNDGNRNFACARCHAGGRPEYASGHHTWNSSEYFDAVRGSCYDTGKAGHAGMNALTCVHCHDPHKTAGPKWSPPPEQDDNSCLDCHQSLKPEAARAAHTHHPAGSEGARCMNCHMPRINEGLQDMVRTHRIFNPTAPSMIEANQPNACNLCHLDKPIDWTIEHLRDWYGEKHLYDDSKLTANYPERKKAVGEGWLKSPHAPTRLSAAAAYAYQRDPAALPALIELLAADAKLINRQFTQKDLDDWLGLRLKDLGYQFYMTGDERRIVIDKLRDKLLARAKTEPRKN